MKNTIFVACVLLFAVTQSSNIMAKELKEYQAEADQLYTQGNHKKAFKSYSKLAKIGDHYSQFRVSQMYATGEGKSTNMEYAYAWAALAAESRQEKLVNNSEVLLERNDDKAGAYRKAEKLNQKYGKQALDEKAKQVAKRESGRRAGACTGSRLTCSRAYGYGAPISGGPEMTHSVGAGER